MIRGTQFEQRSQSSGQPSADSKLESRYRASECLIACAIVLVAFGLRVYRLGTQSLWGDETISVFRASGSLGEITEAVRHEGTLPPLYYYLLHLWVPLAGSTETSVRFLSLIFGVLAVPLLYVLVRRTLGARTGVLAAALATLSPFWIYYAQETRTYALVTALAILALYLLVRAGEPVTRRKGEPAAGRDEDVWTTNGALWVGYVVAAALALWSYYFAGFVLAAAVLWLLADRRRWPGVALRCVLAQVAVVLLLAPLLVYAGSSLVAQAKSVDRASVPLATVLHQLAFTFNFGTSIDQGQAARLVVVALALAGLGLLSRPRRQALFWGTLLAVPVLAVFAVSFVPHPGWERYFIAASPAWYALVAAGLNALWNGPHPLAPSPSEMERGNRIFPPLHLRWRGGEGVRPPGSTAQKLATRRGNPAPLTIVVKVIGRLVTALASAALLLGIVPSLHNYYFDPAYWRNDLRSAERPVEAVATPDVAVIVNGPPQFPSFFYYFRKTIPWFELPASRTTGEQTLGTLDGLTKRYRGLWFVKYHPPDYDPNNYVEIWLSQHAYLVSSRWVENMTFSFYATDDPTSSHVVAAAPIGRTFATDAALVSYRASVVRAQDADYLLVTLSWRALRTPAQSDKVFAHLVDRQGKLVAQSDHFPEADFRPTSTWKAGDVMDDQFALKLPADDATRGLRLDVGLYHADGSRLPIQGDSSPDRSLSLVLPGLSSKGSTESGKGG
ncbi:MAG TPA: glycosyltransferase family 39 protein [Chloroflexota bacterium]|nr:glycosyltransferase family 39 protein [Chloroflexota bacterium]